MDCVYEPIVIKRLHDNINELRDDIKNGVIKKGIYNHCELWGDDVREVIEKIMMDDRFARFFVKDPKKQNIYEEIFFNTLSDKGIPITKLPASGKNAYHLSDGNIKKGTSTSTSTKSLDFRVDNCMMYNKYIKEKGGAQDNQYRDLIHFLQESKKYTETHNDDMTFVAVADGPYFDDKQDDMDQYTNNRVMVKTINDY